MEAVLRKVKEIQGIGKVREHLEKVRNFASGHGKHWTHN